MIGHLRNHVTIVRKTYKSDGYGGQVFDKDKTKKVWAHIKTASGNEALTDGAVQNQKTRQLIIRNTDISASDFIILDGEEWNISNIERLDDKPYYLVVSIRAKEVTGA